MIGLLSVLHVPFPAHGLPNEIAQTGILTNAAGVPLNGEHSIRIRIYNAPRGGQRLFEETHRNVDVIEGRYFIGIGSQEVLPDRLFEEAQLFFSVSIDDGEEIGARLPIVKVPAAMVADIAMDVRGQIRPESIRIGNQVVINEAGEWVGSPTGLQGPAGPPGAAGPVGPMGAQGPAGIQGPAGPRGPSGNAGEAGQDGSDGQAGADADPAAVVPLVIDSLTANPNNLPFVHNGQAAQKAGHLSMTAPAELRFESADPVYTAIRLANHNIGGINLIEFNDPGPNEGLNWRGTAAHIFVSPLDNSHADGYLRLQNDGGISLESSIRVIGHTNVNNYNISGVNAVSIHDPGPTEGLMFTGTGAKVVVSPLDDSNADGYLRLINDGGISLESSVYIAGHITVNDYNVSNVNTLQINDPGPTEGLLFSGTQAKVVVSPLDNSNADGYLRLINDGGISLESSVHLAGHMNFNNYNLSGVNTVSINDPGPTEGLIFTGTQAKVVVAPLDNSNADGYLRLINDGGISLESHVRITGDLQMEANAEINLRDQPIRGVGNPGLIFADPGPDGALQWAGTQAQIYVAPLNNGNSDGYLRILNDGGISLESTVRMTGHTDMRTFTTRSARIVRRKGVFDFTHPSGGYARGQEWANRYYHIRTPDTAGNSEMFRYDLTGYSYGIGRPLSFTWVGYLYSGNRQIINGRCRDNAGNGIGCSVYQGSDNHLYLKFGPVRQYYNSFVLDYQSGSTGERIDHSAGGYSITLRPDNGNL